MKQFFSRRWFLVMLGLVLLAGFFFPVELRPVRDALPQDPVVAIVLFVMALPIEAGAMWAALKRPKPVILAVVINYGLLPLMAWAVSLRLQPRDLAVGLIIAASVPSTLASAAVWTRRAGGNDSIATLVMMVTNLACFIVTPFLILLMTGSDPSAKMPFKPAEMVLSLALFVVLPIVLAQLARLIAPVARWAGNQKGSLGVLAQIGVLSMVLVGAISSGLEMIELGPSNSIGLYEWTAMLASVVGIHLTMLWLGHALGRLLGIAREDRIAVGFAGSQKTQMVGVHLSLTYGGLTILPMVAYHVCQLLVDTLIADRLAAANKVQTDEPPDDPREEAG